jgi:hypothetical protein
MLEQIMNEPIRQRPLAIEMIDLSVLRPYAKNARRQRHELVTATTASTSQPPPSSNRRN